MNKRGNLPPSQKQQTGRKRKGKRKGMCMEDRPLLEQNAAGIDIGATEMYVAVGAERDPQPIRCFETFTQDLYALADWLQKCGIRTVAMESTSVYWIPLFQKLEAAGLEAVLVNARHVRHVPGRNGRLCAGQASGDRSCGRLISISMKAIG